MAKITRKARRADKILPKKDNIDITVNVNLSDKIPHTSITCGYYSVMKEGDNSDIFKNKCLKYIKENYDKELQLKFVTFIKKFKPETEASWEWIYTALTFDDVENFKKYKSFNLLWYNTYEAQVCQEMWRRQAENNFSLEESLKDF